MDIALTPYYHTTFGLTLQAAGKCPRIQTYTVCLNLLYKNLKWLRNEQELTQKDIATKLNVNPSTYKNWENGVVIIPLDIADKLSVFYNVRLSCILGIENIAKYKNKINPINYTFFLEKINLLKKKIRILLKKLEIL